MSRNRQRILLSGVFGPFGVDDEFGRKENIMELFHNQVTKAQGVASFRYHHRSFGLYFIAENIDADVTVLDFPSRRRFEREVAKGYDVVGVSFIAPNFVKAREMARITRARAPEATLVLGGHGAAIEGIDELIDCDHVVQGEGIRWMRRFLGQDPDAPLVHPSLPSTERTRIMGIPVPGTTANLLVPGVGCVNGCNFCSTSHFFGKCYTPFLSTGQEIFDTCCRLAEERGTDEFFVMDENFLKDRQRALDLLGLMEEHDRPFVFQVFSSAEAISAFGVDNMVRLGVTFVWIGVESRSEQGNYDKNRGIDPAELIAELRSKGIIVLASGILCQEHHTPENIGLDIDFLVGLKSDFVQFMLLTPLPTTALYRSQQQRGMLREDLPFEENHGQKHLAYRHPHFPGDAAETWITRAFQQDYQVNSSSLLRVIQTSLWGYQRLAAMQHRDTILDARMAKLEGQVRNWCRVLPAIARFPANDLERRRAQDLAVEIEAVLPLTLAQKAARLATPWLTAAWSLRLSLVGDVLQPPTLVTRYEASMSSKGRKLIGGGVQAAKEAVDEFDQAAAAVSVTP
jgi:hypothetical protein